MIVRSITVENWRCYLDPVTIGPFDDRLNVIYGPNATGKSTLFEALQRALLDSHRVTGEAIGLIAPWGRPGLAPRVTIEFVHDGVEYRIRKQFLRNQSSMLERKEKGRFVRWREGFEADEWVRALISHNPPGRGLARYENWGLAQILWAPQGNLSLSGLSGDLTERVRSSLGAQLATAESGALEEQIEELYLAVYTRSGRLKTGRDAAPLVTAQKKLEEVQSRRDAAREKLRKFEEAGAKVKALRDQQAQAEREAEELRKALEEASGKAEEYKKLQTERDRRKEIAEKAQAQYDHLKRILDDIRAARRELAEAQGNLEKLNAELPAVEAEIASWQRAAAEAKARLEDVRKERRDAEAARNLAEEARAFEEKERRLAEAGRTLSGVRAAQQALEELERQRADLRAPDARKLKSIREAAQKRREALQNIEPALITLEIVPERETAVEVIDGETVGPKTAPAGAPLQIRGAPQVAVDLPGIARLRAWGPAESLEPLRKALADAERTLRKLLEPFDTEDIEELERRSEQAAELEKAISNRKTEIETLVGGRPVSERDVRELSQKIAELEAGRRAILSRHPEWGDAPPDATALARAAADALKEFLEKEQEAEAALDKSRDALNAAEKRKTGLTEKIAAQDAQLRRCRSRLEGLTADGRTDEEREKELTARNMEWDAARSRLKEVEWRLSALGPDTLETAEKLERQLEALRETATQARDDANLEEGRLRALGSEGPYSEVARLEEEFAELERQVQEEEQRAAAIRLLYETVKECRTEALAAVTAPVVQAASRRLQRIAGDRLGAIRLGESFKPEGVQPAEDTEAPLDSVSGGELEQIHLVTRLALAELLATEERQLVVWDDVLVATDMGRLARVLTLIEEAADRLQIVILTCHPERYRGLAGARFMDLEALVRGA